MDTKQASTGVSSTQWFEATPVVGTLQMKVPVVGTVASGQSLYVDPTITYTYPPYSGTIHDATCAHQWYRDGKALYAETRSDHYVHTMERSTVLQVRARCSLPGYLAATPWSARVSVPGVPALVSFLGGDALRELTLIEAWSTALWDMPGRLGRFDFSAYNTMNDTDMKRMTAIATAGDLDDDGREDIMARDSSGVLWAYPSNASTRVRLGTGWNGMNLFVAGGDFTKDRMADLYVRKSTGELLFYEGRGRQGLAGGKVVAYSAFKNAVRIVTLGDANGDGYADLHVTWPNGDMYFYAGRGTGALAPAVKVGTGWGSMTRLLLGRDLNRDGKADLLALDTKGNLWLYPGNGEGGFTARSLTNSGHPLSTRIY